MLLAADGSQRAQGRWGGCEQRRAFRTRAAPGSSEGVGPGGGDGGEEDAGEGGEGGAAAAAGGQRERGALPREKEWRRGAFVRSIPIDSLYW